MYPEQAVVINDIQRSKINDKDFVCRAVQEYYKQLNSISAIKTTKKITIDDSEVENMEPIKG